jgi:hypothetical protein
MRNTSFGVLVLLVAGFGIGLAGCGGGVDLDAADQRIKALEAQGAPDSILSKPKVFLYNAKTAKNMGNSGQLRRNGDSLMIFLEKAEAEMTGSVEMLKPVVDSLRQSIGERMQKLTGIHKRVAEELVTVVDSFIDKGWVLQARDKARELDVALEQLLADEEHAQKIRSRIPGSWTGAQVWKSGPINAVRQTNYKFSRDGTVRVSDVKKGRSEEYLKEDWKFVSWGTWDLRGDTVFLTIEREKCEKQNFWHLRDGKWVKESSPTYDTTITDGSKDMFVTYAHLKDKFQHK